MLREYELQGFLLVVYITDKHWFKEPNLIIRINVRTFDFQVSNRKPSWNRAYVLDEVRRLFELLETPYWKSIVNLKHRYNHPDTYGPLL